MKSVIPSKQPESIFRLSENQDGAMMVMGVFMAVFLVGILFYTVGIGDALLHRERMQDAADAAAFSAAVVHARGMNVIVLINIIMAALMAILVALKVVETLIIVAIVLVTVMSYFTGGASASAIPVLEELRETVDQEADEVKDIIFPWLRILHGAARGVRSVVPPVAQLRVVDTVVGHYHPPADFGFVIPSRMTLPTVNDRFKVLCEKAGIYAGSLIGLPFKEFGGAVGDIISDVISEAAGGLAGSLSNWFCGDGSPNFEPIKVTYTETLPTLASRAQCIEYGNNVGDKSKYSKTEHERFCGLAENEERDSSPDETDGYCQAKGQVDESIRCQPYWDRVAAARLQCKPDSGGKLKNYQWQEQSIKLYYRYDGPLVGWRLVREVVDSRIERGDKSPCAQNDWNGDIGIREADQSRPVCSEYNETQCERPETTGNDENAQLRNPVVGETTTPCEFTEVAQVFACERSAEKSLNPNQGAQTSFSREEMASGSNSVPQRMDEIGLGDNDFQMRSVVYGPIDTALSATAVKAIRMTMWGHEESPTVDIYDAARQLGRFSVAQAEYYYSGSETRGEWMWHMDWRARLKRFRLPQSRENEQTSQATSDRDPSDEPFADNSQERPEDAEHAFELSKQRNGGGGDSRESGGQGQSVQESLNLLDSLVLH
jgi:hypothetical protein